MYFSAALFVHGKRLVGKLLDYLEQITAVFAFVFVKRHKKRRFKNSCLLTGALLKNRMTAVNHGPVHLVHQLSNGRFPCYQFD